MQIRAKAKRRLRGSGDRCEVLQQPVVRPLQDGDGAAGRIHLRRGHRAAGQFQHLPLIYPASRDDIIITTR